MAKSYNQKVKILYLQKMLYETGEDRVVTMQEILTRLLEYGIHAERKSIYDDIESLRSFGMDVKFKRGRPGGYYVAGQMALEKQEHPGTPAPQEVTREPAGEKEQQPQDRKQQLKEKEQYPEEKEQQPEEKRQQLKEKEQQLKEKRQQLKEKEQRLEKKEQQLEDKEHQLEEKAQRLEKKEQQLEEKERQLEEKAQWLEKKQQSEEMSPSPVYNRKFTKEPDSGNGRQIKLLCRDKGKKAVQVYFGKAAQYKEKELGYFTVTANITEDSRFYGWLATMGQDVHILKPKKVAVNYREYLKTLAKEYKGI